MISVMYQNAFSEVIEYLKGISKTDIEKISSILYSKVNDDRNQSP